MNLAAFALRNRTTMMVLTALLMIGGVLEQLDVAECCWFLDRPVSNSGRLATIIREMCHKVLGELGESDDTPLFELALRLEEEGYDGVISEAA